jgi:hypothetical protein
MSLPFLWISLETLTVDLILSTFQPVRPLCNGKKDAIFEDHEICYDYKYLRKKWCVNLGLTNVNCVNDCLGKIRKANEGCLGDKSLPY